MPAVVASPPPAPPSASVRASERGLQPHAHAAIAQRPKEIFCTSLSPMCPTGRLLKGGVERFPRSDRRVRYVANMLPDASVSTRFSRTATSGLRFATRWQGSPRVANNLLSPPRLKLSGCGNIESRLQPRGRRVDARRRAGARIIGRARSLACSSSAVAARSTRLHPGRPRGRWLKEARLRVAVVAERDAGGTLAELPSG